MSRCNEWDSSSGHIRKAVCLGVLDPCKKLWCVKVPITQIRKGRRDLADRGSKGEWVRSQILLWAEWV